MHSQDEPLPPQPPRWTPLRASVAVLALISLLAAFAINVPLGSAAISPGARQVVATLQPTPAFSRGQKILLLSPHPDDETLCCAGLIQRAQASGAQVYVAWMTSGDGFELDASFLSRQLDPSDAAMLALGNRRMGEARRAAELLGLPAGHLFFLGYPDGGLLHLFMENYAAPYTSGFTGRNAVPYSGVVVPGASYTGLNFEKGVEQVIERVRPDLVLAPSPQDEHPDHRATGFVATRLMAERGQAAHMRYYVVHGGLEWPLPKGSHPSLALTLPPRARQLAWTRFDLTPAEERLKGEVIRSYTTQMHLLARFMTAFERRNELIAESGLPVKGGPARTP